MTIDCSGDLTVLADVLEKSLLETMGSELQPGELQDVNVYQLCGQAAPLTYLSTSSFAETTVSVKSIVTSQKSGDDLFQVANQALETSISSGNLVDRINTNSNGTITAVISDTVVSTFEVTTNPPTFSPTSGKPTAKPTNRPTRSKAGKNSKTQTQSPISNKPTYRPTRSKAGKRQTVQ